MKLKEKSIYLKKQKYNKSYTKINVLFALVDRDRESFLMIINGWDF